MKDGYYFTVTSSEMTYIGEGARATVNYMYEETEPLALFKVEVYQRRKQQPKYIGYVKDGRVVATGEKLKFVRTRATENTKTNKA